MWDWALLNENKALWLRAPGEVDEEDYEKFYKALAKVRHHGVLASCLPALTAFGVPTVCIGTLPISSTSRCQRHRFQPVLYGSTAPCFMALVGIGPGSCRMHCLQSCRTCTRENSPQHALRCLETPAPGAGRAGTTCRRKPASAS